MATGTGKTKTCIALIYRLLKTKRFRRILFLVDRSALGEQAANSFKDTRMENLNTFADVFGIKEIDEQKPDTETAVHIATIQGMVQRVLYPSEGNPAPAVDQYDCIIVDECHRGYLLDRELSETEMTFRSFDDYVSKYRRVLDYFAAVKIGLTATPALHTTEIFGAPIYTYSYREAVIDGYLVDHEPPFKIRTELSEQGIVWNSGDEVERRTGRRGKSGYGADLEGIEIKSAIAGSSFEYQYHLNTGLDKLKEDQVVDHFFCSYSADYQSFQVYFADGKSLTPFFSKWIPQYIKNYKKAEDATASEASERRQRFRRSIAFGRVSKNGQLVMQVTDAKLVFPAKLM